MPSASLTSEQPINPTVSGRKRCTKCLFDKALSEMKILHRSTKKRGPFAYYSSWCIDCHRGIIRKWHAANRDKVNANVANWVRRHPGEDKRMTKKYRDKNRDFLRATGIAYWRARGPDAQKDSALRQRYGIGLNQKMALLELQGGGCAICGDKQPKNEKFYLDHCHATGAIRGILCLKCNTGLGCYNDNPTLMLSAISYLQRGAADAAAS